jgi:gas vesicle protein
MKNPFKKEDHTKLIAAIAIATVTVGAIAILYLTDKGKETRKALKKKIKSFAKDAAADAISKKTKIKKQAAKAVADHVVKTD